MHLRGLLAIPLVAVGVALAFRGGAPAQAAVDLTGDWHFDIEGTIPNVGELSTECTAEITQTGDMVESEFECDIASGTFDATITQLPLGASIEADLVIDPAFGPDIVATATGSVAADGNTFSGEWESDQFGSSGTFTAEREVFQYLKGDVDCTGNIDGGDVLQEFLVSIGLETSQQPGCPALEAPFADLDCDDEPAISDGEALLHYLAGLTFALPDECLGIGETFTLPAN